MKKTRLKNAFAKPLMMIMGLIIYIALLSVLGIYTDLRFAIVLGIVLLIFFAIGYDVLARRERELQLMQKMQRQDKEYTRLIREIARNRNELLQLKSGLVETGRAAAQVAEGHALNSVEEKMLNNIATQLANLGNAPRPKADEAPVEEEEAITNTPVDYTAPVLRANKGPDDEQILDLLRTSVNDDSIDVFLQPMVSLPQRKLRYFEMFSRVRFQGDQYIPARRYIDLAMKSDLLPAIDNLLLLRALQLVRDIDPAGDGAQGYFCNITPLTLADSKFMGDLVEFISQNRPMAPRLIFELSYDDMIDPTLMTPEIEEILRGLAKLGCGFSIENIRPGMLDIRYLKGYHIRYAKMDSNDMLSFMGERGGYTRMKKLKTDMDEAKVDLIVTHIESEKDLLELLDLGIDYGQGYLFGIAEKTVI